MGTLVLNSVGDAMLRKLLSFWFLLMLTLNPYAYSSHIYGGDLLYKHISGNTYRIIVVLYGDCAAPDSNVFNGLKIAAPEVYIYDGNSTNPGITTNLPIDTANSNIEVTPVCADEINNTICKGGTLPGIKKFTYYQDVTLTAASDNWRIIFTGGLGGTTSAGRTQSITNIVFGTNLQIMYLVARLNNLNGANSSPVYTTIPTPFYCINVPQQYNHGASDPDGDSLSFALVPGLMNGNPTGYVPPYSATEPLSASSFSFNTLNGQLSFTPDLVQRSLVVNEVTEYKNGVLMGSSMREMSFIVLANCQNQPPDGDLLTHGTGFSGGIHQGNNVINVCAGTPEVSFNLSPADPDATDSVILTVNNIPAGANVTIQNNNTLNPVVNFNWNTSAVPTGIYTFYINYKDNGCPLSSNQTVAYTIQILNPYTVAAEVLSPTHCFHKAAVRYTLSNGTIPRTVEVKQSGATIRTYTDSTGIIEDSLYAGSYTVHVFSNYFNCDTIIDFVVADSGQYPLEPLVADAAYCTGDNPLPLSVSGVGGSTLQWYDVNGNPLPGEPAFNTYTAPASYTWYVSQLVNVCSSDTTAIHVIVNTGPDITITTQPGKVCYADRIFLEATGAQNYYWFPISNIHKDAAGKTYAIITQPSTFTVIGTDGNTCKDTAEISYTQIEQCCNFAYPNAFTPNNDGKNDRFRPVMYGNMEEYEISVYNRFGERIYHSKDSKNGWDGTYNSKPCDIGMYYFTVKARCFTGQEETKYDAFDLLR